jgi:hypothetical protein
MPNQVKKIYVYLQVFFAAFVILILDSIVIRELIKDGRKRLCV